MFTYLHISGKALNNAYPCAISWNCVYIYRYIDSRDRLSVSICWLHNGAFSLKKTPKTPHHAKNLGGYTIWTSWNHRRWSVLIQGALGQHIIHLPHHAWDAGPLVGKHTAPTQPDLKTNTSWFSQDINIQSQKHTYTHIYIYILNIYYNIMWIVITHNHCSIYVCGNMVLFFLWFSLSLSTSLSLPPCVFRSFCGLLPNAFPQRNRS